MLVNDCLLQFANLQTPFGGVGHSGMGDYHGKYSFKCFSQRRVIIRRDDHRFFESSARYPPYKASTFKTFRKLATFPYLPDYRHVMRSLVNYTLVGMSVLVVLSLSIHFVEFDEMMTFSLPNFMKQP